MSVFSEIATENTIFEIVKIIEREMKARKDQPEAVEALKSVGYRALGFFEWSTPEWAHRYYGIFTQENENFSQITLDTQGNP